MRNRLAFSLVATLAVLGAACSSGSQGSSTPTTTSKSSATPIARTPAGGLPPIRHVFLIVLENEGYAATFASPAADPYLATTLPAAGALLANYYGIGHHSADN